MKVLLPAILLLTLTLTHALRAQYDDHVNWKFSWEQVDRTDYVLTFEASIDAGWYLFSTDVPEKGPIPTTFKFDPNSQIEFIGTMNETATVITDDNDPVFDLPLKKLAGKAKFTQKIKLLKEGTFVKGTIEFMTSDQKKCLPPKRVEFFIKI